MENASSGQTVSVIIPTYNRENFIQNSVTSVINQANVETEIIVIDDGSEDNTQTVVNSLQEKYPNLSFYQNERSKGPSGARNTGLLKSSGEFLAFLDSDDIWLDAHLATGLNVLNLHPEIDVFFGNFSIVEFYSGKRLYDFFDQKRILHGLKSKRISPKIRILQDNLFCALIQENFFSLGSSIIRKSLLKNIHLDESVRFAEDLDFAIRLFKEANATFAYRTDPVFIAYRHDSNFYAGGGPKISLQVIKAEIYLLSKYLKFYKLSDKELKILYRRFSTDLARLSLLHCKNYDYRSTLSCTLKSFKYGVSLFQCKTLMKLLITLMRNWMFKCN